MNKMFRYILSLFVLVNLIPLFAQEPADETIKLTLEDVVEVAKDQSLMALMSRHQFRSSYWAYRAYIAETRPSLTLDGTVPSFTNAKEAVQQGSGEIIYRDRQVMQTSLDLQLNQNIGLTGGRFFVSSQLQRTDNFGDEHMTDYLAYPVTIGFYQPINGYNSFKWDRKIEPLKYENAKLEYINAIENVSKRAVSYFFDLALAQINLEIEKKNMANNDTLYNIATGRYQLGTIAENELLQMELSYLNSEKAFNEAIIDLELRKSRLRSFLGYNSRVNLELILPHEMPELNLDYQRVLEEAQANNPEVMDMNRQLLEAEQRVAEARSNKGVRGNLYAEFGLNQVADNLRGAYQEPLPQERVNVGIQIPLLDWGQGKGRYKMAQSSEEVVRTNVQQSMIQFDENIFLQVMQFNLQDDQVNIATKADTIANLRYEVTKQRFLIGKIDVLELKDALEEKDVARRGYVQALRNYWDYFYNLRELTLYDWLINEKLSENYDELLDQ